MKHIILLAIIVCSAFTAAAEKRDSTTITVNNKTVMVHIGDTVQLGYGANVDGSFMYILNMNEGLGKGYASQKAVIKKIIYIKATGQLIFRLKGKRWQMDALIPQAIEKKEILSVRDVVFY
jgi:hypothetical protein